VDSSGNLFIVDSLNRRIRRVDAETGIITTVAGGDRTGFSGDGGPATGAALNFPWGVAVDSAGNLFIADTRNHRIRRVDAATQIITTVAGSGTGGGFDGDGGPATIARLNSPRKVAVDGAGNLLITDSSNHRIRRVDAITGNITTVAGSGPTAGPGTFTGDGGPATNARLNEPRAATPDKLGNLIIADGFNNRIRRVTAYDE
jgi:sugar lactone lactonase YvrE